MAKHLEYDPMQNMKHREQNTCRIYMTTLLMTRICHSKRRKWRPDCAPHSCGRLHPIWGPTTLRTDPTKQSEGRQSPRRTHSPTPTVGVCSICYLRSNDPCSRAWLSCLQKRSPPTSSPEIWRISIGSRRGLESPELQCSAAWAKASVS